MKLREYFESMTEEQRIILALVVLTGIMVICAIAFKGAAL